MADLQSPRFADDPVLESCLDGTHRMHWPEKGDAVAKVQQALIDLQYSIPSGATGNFGQETGKAVTQFKQAHQLSPSDPVVDPGTMAALDADIIAFDAGNAPVPSPPATLQSVTFWINAFIPDPSLTPFVFPAPGESSGQSMVVVSEIVATYYFLGDNRIYSSELAASSRIHSLVEVTHLDTADPVINAAEHKCGDSIEIDTNGQVIGRDKTPTNRISFADLRGNTTIDANGDVVVDSPNPGYVQLDYVAAANLPLLAGSPDIDMNGNIAIDRDALNFSFRGSVDGSQHSRHTCPSTTGSQSRCSRWPPYIHSNYLAMRPEVSVSACLSSCNSTAPVNITAPKGLDEQNQRNLEDGM